MRENPFTLDVPETTIGLGPPASKRQRKDDVPPKDAEWQPWPDQLVRINHIITRTLVIMLYARPVPLIY